MHEEPKGRVRAALSVTPFSRLRNRIPMTRRTILYAALALFLIIASLWAYYTYPTLFRPSDVPAQPGDLGPDAVDHTSFAPAAGADDPAAPSTSSDVMPATGLKLTPSETTPPVADAGTGTSGGTAGQPETPATPPQPVAPSRLAWPIRGQQLTAFGIVYSTTLNDWRSHDGVDLAVASGGPILAAADGTVVSVEATGPTGLTVVVDHGGGLTTAYGALLISGVEPGERLTVGAEVGKAGNSALTEVALPAHLHFEVRLNGAAIDPAGYLR